MAVYTVYEPPVRAGDDRHADRFVFVRDGFFWSAFLFAPFWMLRHRLWPGLVLYVLLAVALAAGAQAFRLSAATVAVTALFASLLIGFEASSLWRWVLSRRRWRNVGVVVGDDLELAERRVFDARVRRELPSRGPPARRPRAPGDPRPPGGT